MDLLSIIRAVWLHKLVAIPVILLTAIAAFYVYAVKPPVYEASSSLLLLNPPGPPTAAQIAADHKLAKISTNNPYVNLGFLPEVADAVIELVTSSAAQQSLVQAGANPQYRVALSSDYGNPPIIHVTGVGPSAQEAIKSANLVTAAAKADLYQMQKEQGVNRLYMITATQLVQPDQAQTKVSGKLRTLVAVLGLGIVLLFIAISLAEGIKRQRMSSSINTGTSAGVPQQDARAHDNTSAAEEPRAPDYARRQGAPSGYGAGPRRQPSAEPRPGQPARQAVPGRPGVGTGRPDPSANRRG